MSVEEEGGVSSRERSQANRKKTQAEQYSSFHKLDNNPYVDSDEVEDRGHSRETKVLEESML